MAARPCMGCKEKLGLQEAGWSLNHDLCHGCYTKQGGVPLLRLGGRELSEYRVYKSRTEGKTMCHALAQRRPGPYTVLL